jgi:mRNA interferase MazF
MTRGEVYFVDLDPVIGHEQYGRRPVVVVSNDFLNALPLVVAVVPGTKAANVRGSYQNNVFVPAGEAGLTMDTVFLCLQIRSLDHSRFPAHPAGSLSPARMAKIEDALRYVLEL